MTAAGPVSSATWQINLMSRGPETHEGWWLLRAEAEQARGGFSTQSMQVWDADRRPVAIGMQSVAIFA
jgi:acyl-CoA thioesterase